MIFIYMQINEIKTDEHKRLFYIYALRYLNNMFSYVYCLIWNWPWSKLNLWVV